MGAITILMGNDVDGGRLRRGGLRWRDGDFGFQAVEARVQPSTILHALS